MSNGDEILIEVRALRGEHHGTREELVAFRATATAQMLGLDGRVERLEKKLTEKFAARGQVLAALVIAVGSLVTTLIVALT